MKRRPPIAHWSYSSLTAYLRNPLAWYKRYVEHVYDTPASPASLIGRAGHTALEHFYKGLPKEEAIQRGLEYLHNVQDIEINFGKKARSKRAKKAKRKQIEREYKQAVSFYLKRPPRHKVIGVEVSGVTEVEGLALPIKAISDLVVRSRADKEALDIVDHKFVNTFSKLGGEKTLFVLQAIFNYYTVRNLYNKPIRRFIIQECKRTKNADGSSQMRRHIINFNECEGEFALFHKLVNDVTRDITERRVFLPNPSDMFEGEDSFNIYRLGLVDG